MSGQSEYLKKSMIDLDTSSISFMNTAIDIEEAANDFQTIQQKPDIFNYQH